jgi:hypothetical protein
MNKKKRQKSFDGKAGAGRFKIFIEAGQGVETGMNYSSLNFAPQKSHLMVSICYLPLKK